MTREYGFWDQETRSIALHEATLQVAAEIAYQNTTIIDLEIEILEKLEEGYKLEDMIDYIDSKILPGSARRIRNLAQASLDSSYNSPEQQSRRSAELQEAFLAGYNSVTSRP